MPLRFPDFTNSDCKILRCCGILVDVEDEELLALLNTAGQDGWLKANTKSGDSQLVVRAGFGDLDGMGDIPETHFHIDVSDKTRSFKRPNDTSTTITAIRKSVSRFYGQRILLDVEGHFFFAEDEYPMLVEATRSRLRTGDISAVADSVSFKVDGPTSIYGIHWHVLDDNDVVVVIEARVSAEVGDTYVLDAFEFVELANELYVTGKPDDE